MKTNFNLILIAFFLMATTVFLLAPACKSEMSLLPKEDNPIDTLMVVPEIVSTDSSLVKCWKWDTISIPPYTYPDATAFGNGLFVDVAYDTMGVSIKENRLQFNLNPLVPISPSDTLSPNNYRSEIRTAPWQIQHPIGTEQWIGWRYYFSEDYVIDPTSPITIFQNHPGIRGESPQFELEIAAHNRPAPALGGEIQVVSIPDRIVYPVTPQAGDSLDIVIHVVYGLEENGLLKVWLNHELFYDKKISTVYESYPWGGNNKWGIYHHTFYHSPEDVASSIDAGSGNVKILMGPLRLMTRYSDHPEYKLSAYHFVTPTLD